MGVEGFSSGLGDRAKVNGPSISNPYPELPNKRIGGTIMTHRERWLKTFHFEPVDHVPDEEFGYWDDTLRRWHSEGLPEFVNDNGKADQWFGFAPRRGVPVHHGLRSFTLRNRTSEPVPDTSDEARSSRISQGGRASPAPASWTCASAACHRFAPEDAIGALSSAITDVHITERMRKRGLPRRRRASRADPASCHGRRKNRPCPDERTKRSGVRQRKDAT